MVLGEREIMEVAFGHENGAPRVWRPRTVECKGFTSVFLVSDDEEEVKLATIPTETVAEYLAEIERMRRAEIC
ncbi:MAG: hypothetical protein Kow00109_04380 [Acidobacteriota bacterium]